MQKWKHPTLGSFEFKDLGWSRKIAMPAFKPFRYKEFGKLKTRATIELVFLACDTCNDNQPLEPSMASIRTADRILRDQDVLFGKVLNAVWQDLNGKGPDSGMWWHGDQDTIKIAIESGFGWGKPMPLSEKEDLFKLMGLVSIAIHQSHYSLGKACAEFCFESAIDPEHGIGVLCDGRKIIGIGHQLDADLFE